MNYIKINERIESRGLTLLQLGLSNNTDMQARYNRLNPQQRRTVVGWLGKLKSWSVQAAIERIETRIKKDSQQGKKK